MPRLHSSRQERSDRRQRRYDASVGASRFDPNQNGPATKGNRQEIAITNRLIALFITVGLSTATSLHPQVAPWPAAGPFVVNSFTLGAQDEADVAVNGEGDLVIVWSGRSAADLDGISAQRFSNDGTPLGSAIDVNNLNVGDQSEPTVELAEDGSFIVAWRSVVDDFPDDIETIQLRRFGSDGLPLANEERVDTFTTGSKRSPASSMADNGDFIIVWASEGSSETDNSGLSIQGQRYLANGATSGGEFQINTVITDDQFDPDVALQPDGGFWASWTSNDGVDSRLVSQRFASNGTPEGELPVSPVDPGEDYSDSAVAVDSTGAPTIVGTSEPTVDAFGRRRSPTGVDEGFFVVGSGALVPEVAVSPEGVEIVVWNDIVTGFGGVRVWRADGSALHDAFYLPGADPDDLQIDPRVATAPDGSFVVAWQDASSDIMAQRYLGESIFADGFESGDTTQWMTE